MNRSFANCRWVIGAKSLANLIPLILLEAASLSISFDSTSNARTKRKGERGSPCLSPLCGLKCPNGLPWIKIEKEVVVTHCITHWIQIWGKPKVCHYHLEKRPLDFVICRLYINFKSYPTCSPFFLLHLMDNFLSQESVFLNFPPKNKGCLPRGDQFVQNFFESIC